ncbi:MAG TPA: hypothetical protein VI792_03050, partial [Candidatus Eisenbacteria bacterium]
ERHVDPYEILEDASAGEPGRSMHGASSSGSPFAPATPPEPEDEWPLDTETEDEDRLVGDVEPAVDAEHEDAEAGDVDEAGDAYGETGETAGPPPEGPRFGRRPGRSRRGGGV